jgi:hypothetical protein
LHYRENDRVMFVEIDFRDPVIYLDVSLITGWEPPYENEEISLIDRRRILDNINHYLVNERVFTNVDYATE